MASTADIRNGVVLLIDGQLWNVIEFQHVKPGKGGAFVRTKLKNVVTGKVVDRTYNAGAKIDIENVDRRDYQYLYKDGDDFVFMDGETYEQLPISATIVGDAANYLLENQSATIAINNEPAALRRAARLRRARGHLHRARPAGRPLERRHEARDARDGCEIQVPLFLERARRSRWTPARATTSAASPSRVRSIEGAQAGARRAVRRRRPR